ncbi:MAG: hypothetical protein JWM88_3328 [Verrucomicrobia bacterium]|nr:hypothetical protein [Verrucomicrobiota bacterium]
MTDLARTQAALIGSWHRQGLIAVHTVRTAVRQKMLGAWVLLAVALVIGALALGEFNFGKPELKFIADLGSGAIALFGAAFAATATIQLFFEEMEHRTALTLLARPVSRAEFLLGKFFGVAALVAAYSAGMTALLAAVLRVREMALVPEGRVVRCDWVVIVGILLWLKLTVVAAFSLVVASGARGRFFATAVCATGFVLGHLHDLAHAAAAQTSWWLHALLADAVCLLVPDLALFSAENYDGAWSVLPWRIIYALAYTAAACALAAGGFRRREL